MHATTSQNGGKNSPSRLDAALAFLRAGLRPDGTYPGVSEWETAEHQWRLFETWAANTGLTLPEDFNPDRAGGREHDVYFDAASRRWFKFTKESSAGYVVNIINGKLVMLNATPLQYLERWKTHNRIFADDVKLAGLRQIRPGASRIVVSQADVIGEPASWQEIEQAFVQRAGMKAIPYTYPLGGYESRAYFKGRLAVFDVRPRNCLTVSGSGELAAIDVIPQFLSRADADAVSNI